MNPRKRKAATERKAEPPSNMTPTLRREIAGKELLRAIETYVIVILSAQHTEGEWVDQSDSPLGKFAHLQAVRDGRLPGVKHGKRVLVRRTDLNSYLAQHSVKQRSAAGTSDETIDPDRASEVAAQVLTHVGLRQRKGIGPC